METIVKQAREVGTSAGVLLPRSWLNKPVVVSLYEPTLQKIAIDVLEILFTSNLNNDAKGIYLYGSYARKDYDFNSDIDVLVITQNINKLINHNNYEVLLVSEDVFLKNLSANLNYQSILMEYEVILNKELIERIKLKSIKFNSKKLISEISSITKINKETMMLLKDNSLKVPDGIVYSIILRLRELYMIKCLKSNKKYNKEDFISISGEKQYSAYNRIKKDEKELNIVTPDELTNSINLTEKWLRELKD